jgi:uncharacterized protein involved in exopolysaccharide biosynthesis
MTAKRYLSTLYRGRWLYLPVLLLMLAATGVGTYYLARTQYEATARIWVDKPLLENVLAPNAPPGYLASPAQQQADKLYQLLQTDSFLAAALKRTAMAGSLTGDMDRDRETIEYVRKRLGVTPLGSNTVRITYWGSDPALCQQVVQGTIDQFRTWDLTARVEQTSIERQFYEKQLQIYEDQVNGAAKRVEDFQGEHPYPDPSSPQYLELQRLQRELESARGLYNATRTKIDQANAADSLADTSRRSEFQIIDAPTVPTRPTATLMRLAKYVGLGLVASFGLLCCAVAFATWQDTTIRNVDDLRRLTRAPLLDAIPRLQLEPAGDRRGRRPERGGRPVPTLSGPIEEHAAS